MANEYKSPHWDSSPANKTPEQLHPSEFHQNISSASGRWIPCECHDGDWRAHFAGLQKVLREILAQDERKKRGA